MSATFHHICENMQTQNIFVYLSQSPQTQRKQQNTMDQIYNTAKLKIIQRNTPLQESKRTPYQDSEESPTKAQLMLRDLSKTISELKHKIQLINANRESNLHSFMKIYRTRMKAIIGVWKCSKRQQRNLESISKRTTLTQTLKRIIMIIARSKECLPQTCLRINQFYQYFSAYNISKIDQWQLISAVENHKLKIREDIEKECNSLKKNLQRKWVLDQIQLKQSAQEQETQWLKPNNIPMERVIRKPSNEPNPLLQKFENGTLILLPIKRKYLRQQTDNPEVKQYEYQEQNINDSFFQKFSYDYQSKIREWRRSQLSSIQQEQI